MLSQDITLNRAAEIVDLADIVSRALVELRDSTTDEEWDKLMDNQKLESLLDACTDLEASCTG